MSKLYNESMNKFISRYKVKTNNEERQLANVLYDFVIVAIASLIFNGFIVNSNSSPFDQKVFMMLNAGLLSTHWYARTFFAQRYEKKGIDFRALLFFSIFSLGAMAVSIDLMVFAKNNTPERQVFLGKAAMYIWLAGFLLSRFMVFFNYLMATIANKENKSLVKLSIFKSLARLVNVVLAIIGIVLMSVGVDRKYIIYIILPIALANEYLGNVLNVNKTNLKNAPQVSYAYLRERYSKINNVLISAFIISGTIQFAFYFKDSSDMMMLLRIAFVYVIAFFMWWTYSNRVYRFDIKRLPSSHVILGGLNIIIAASLALLGGMLINAYNDKNLSIIIPSVMFSLMVFVIAITLTLQTFTPPKDETFNRPIKLIFIAQAALVIVPLLIVGVISIYFNLSVWVMYGMVIATLLWLSMSSRYVIERKIRNRK